MNTQKPASTDKDFAALDDLMLNTPLAQVPTDFENRLQTALNATQAASQPTVKPWFARDLSILHWILASGGLVLALLQLLRFVLSAWLITHLAY